MWLMALDVERVCWQREFDGWRAILRDRVAKAPPPAPPIPGLGLLGASLAPRLRLRRSEVVALLDDYREGAVTVRSGKGRKERIVYCPVDGREAIVAWLARRGVWPGALLAKSGRIQHMPYVTPLLLISGQPADPPEAHPPANTGLRAMALTSYACDNMLCRR